MKKALTSVLETISRLIPLGLYPKIVRRGLIDFFYHAVSDEPMPHVRHLYPVVPVADFEGALLYLKENYNFITYEQLHAHVFEGESLPQKAVHLSFDDGYAECFSVVRPLLLKHQIPCTFFLTTGLIDNPILFYRNKQSLCVERLIDPAFSFPISDLLLPASAPELAPGTRREFISWFKDLRLPDEPVIDEVCRVLGVDWQAFLQERQPYLTSEQIRQMHTEGFTLGAHTVTHRKLMDLPPGEIENEITESCQDVAAITGQEIVPFSFPNSAWGLDRSHLSSICSPHPNIGLLFDTKGVRKDVPFIHNRVWAERPLTPERKLHTVPEVLYNAYQESWMDEVLGWGRNLRN
jgi:peptidoglycan/xylan/chitin deacetylase (PgdA/CDA1 family)